MSSDAFLAVLLAGQEVPIPDPLAAIDADAPEFIKQCHALACRLLARRIPKRKGQWPASAELVLTAIIAFVCACEKDPEDRTLTTVRHLLGDSRKLDLSFKTKEMCKDKPEIAELGTWYMSTYYRG